MPRSAWLGWVLRNNRTETDALIGIVPPAQARYRGVILEDNRSVASRTGIRVGSGVSGVLRGNPSEGVERPLWDAGSSLWIHPAEALRRLPVSTAIAQSTSPPQSTQVSHLRIRSSTNWRRGFSLMSCHGIQTCSTPSKARKLRCPMQSEDYSAGFYSPSS